MISLKTLPQATEQEVFNQVARHLVEQSEKSADLLDSCAYRGSDGLKCAAGCLIDDDEYDPYWEGESWVLLASKKKLPQVHAQLIADLQKIHDLEDSDDWRSVLTEFAQTRGLDIPEFLR